MTSITSKKAAVHWISNPDRWYDAYRKSIGLPWLQGAFQNSYEAWHFYHDRDSEAPEQSEQIDKPTSSAPRPEPTEKATAPPDLLSPADLILAPGFTLDDADVLARTVKLIDEGGAYHLGPRKLGAVVGFALALQQAGKLTGAIPALTAVLGPRWGVNITTRKTATGVAQKYLKLTDKVLGRPKKTE